VTVLAQAMAAVWLLGMAMQVRTDPDLGISEALARARAPPRRG
jgi:hypothetical protein